MAPRARLGRRDTGSPNRFSISLPVQILGAVVIGIALGLLFPGGTVKPLAEVGRAVIHWVKLIAGPFLFLTIVASIIEVRLRAHHAFRLVVIALANTTIAIALGMGLAHLFLDDIRLDMLHRNPSTEPSALTFSSYSWLKTLTPSSVFSPFVQNEILLIALMALLVGIAIRKAYTDPGQAKTIARAVERARAVPEVILHWLIAIIPVAVLTVVAGSVSEHGLAVFSSLLRYVLVVVLGFVLQVTLVYGFWIFLIARIPLKVFWRECREAVLYSFGVNSSLATLPLTLGALQRLGVSRASASLGAGVATNLNNDGIVLYEAMAVFFIAQLSGIELTHWQMLLAALMCMVASAGITGIPEAGFISLSVVVSTLGLPAEALPLLLAVDWMIARLRSVVNVLSDMTLSIALDATEKETHA